jgi:DNA-binding SARP family transcriptional activator
MKGRTGRTGRGSGRSRSNPARGRTRGDGGLLPPSSKRDERRGLAGAARLLSHGRYSEAAAIFHGLEQDYERAGETVAAEALGLAHELCLACRAQRSEVEAHQRASTVAAGVESRLRERLAAILELATSGSSPPDRGGASSTVAPPAPTGRKGRKTRGTRGTESNPPIPSLVVYGLGPLRVYREGTTVGVWPNRRAKAVFKYLVVHRTGPKEVLMELFWPEASPSAARNNLNVAVYALRQFLRQGERDFSYVLFRDDSYLLNPDLDLWVDVAEFEQLVASAEQLERNSDVPGALRDLQTAETLYQGGLFEDDPYEEWILSRRRELEDLHIGVLDRLRELYVAQGDVAACITVCRKTVAVDRCREDAHAELMRCYAGQGQHYLALRQFNDCKEALRQELDIGPSEELTDLYERIRRRQAL